MLHREKYPMPLQQPDLKRHPAYMNLYPAMPTVLDAIQHIEAQVPVTSQNEMFALLMMYHNTLLNSLDE